MATATKTATRTRTRPKKAAPAAAKAAKTAAKTIRSWQDDPGSPDAALKPVESSAPGASNGALPVAIDGKAPAARLYDPASREFRYWAATEALRRGTAFWSSILPAGTKWYSTVGAKLRVTLDEGEDFNAYYNRHDLHFFHGTAGGRTVYSGESPDVVCHELGHAVLDAVRPQLFDANFIEAAALHESFGDMSALLSALQLESVRQEVLVETGGRVYASSRLSRLAEQLGWALRQFRPDLVEPDCLRNAVNSLFYRDPQGLPPSGPASSLSSEPHSFSRVFTASFLESLAGMHGLQDTQDQRGLLQASHDAATLLIEAAGHCPVVPSYYSQVAAHMIEADATRFGGRYSDVLKAAFVKHGVLSLDSANALADSPKSVVPAMAFGGNGARAADSTPLISLPGRRYGLGEDLLVHAPVQPKRFVVAGAAPDLGSAEPPPHDTAARSFVEDIFRRGRVDVREVTKENGGRRHPARFSHSVVPRAEGLVLVRNFFDGGLA